MCFIFTERKVLICIREEQSELHKQRFEFRMTKFPLEAPNLKLSRTKALTTHMCNGLSAPKRHILVLNSIFLRMAKCCQRPTETERDWREREKIYIYIERWSKRSKCKELFIQNAIMYLLPFLTFSKIILVKIYVYKKKKTENILCL